MFKRFKFSLFRNSSSFEDLGQPEMSPRSYLLKAGHCLRESREGLGMSLRDLAIQTRISTTVLEAIENGWVERLPEAAYLAAMIPLLESHLRLTPGSLEGANQSLKEYGKKQKERKPDRFTPGNIEILTTWQGSIAYVVVILGSIIALNYQQKSIFDLANYSLKPIQAELYSLKEDDYPIVKQIRPLVKAKTLLPKDWLNLATPRKVGVLKINVLRPRSLKIRSSSDTEITIDGLKGKITLKLKTPVLLDIQPPLLKEDSIIWNDKTIEYIPESPGSYSIDYTGTNP